MTLLDPATWSWGSGHMDSLPSYILARWTHLQHKVLPHWVWEKIPDPANSHFSQPYVEVSKKTGLSGTSRGLGDVETVGSKWEQ